MREVCGEGMLFLVRVVFREGFNWDLLVIYIFRSLFLKIIWLEYYNFFYRYLFIGYCYWIFNIYNRWVLIFFFWFYNCFDIK